MGVSIIKYEVEKLGMWFAIFFVYMVLTLFMSRSILLIPYRQNCGFVNCL